MNFRFSGDEVLRLHGPVALLGANGMLGRAFRELFEANAFAVHAMTRRDVDLSRPESLVKLYDLSPRLVINCAAWTDVDGAETNEDAADAVNGRGLAPLSSVCCEVGATLVHFSTDYVFDGVASTPYQTDHSRRPINAYGRTKARGEERIESEMRSGLDALVLRTSWLYAPWGKNFVRTIAAACRIRPSLKVVNDQHGRPTSAEHLARLTVALLNAGARGLQHATDGGECTWFDLACEITRRINPECPVHPCSSDEFPRPARRPAFSTLDLSRTEKLVGQLPDWRDNLAAVLARVEP